MVAFDVRIGPGFVVSENVNGFLAPEGDNDCFIAKLKELMESSELRTAMGEKGINHAAEFSAREVSKLWFSLIGD